jgi:hypothetical protein
VVVRARKYFEGSVRFTYLVRDANDVIAEEVSVFITNDCPPGGPPPELDVDTFVCGDVPDFISACEDFGPMDGECALVGTETGLCVQDLDTGAGQIMNGFFGRCYGGCAWSPDHAVDVILAYGVFGWWSRQFIVANDDWSITLKSSPGEANVTDIKPFNDDRYAAKALWVSFANRHIGTFEIDSGFVLSQGNLVRPEQFPAGESPISAITVDGTRFLVGTVDGAGVSRLCIATPGAGAPTVLVGVLGDNATKFVQAGDTWACRLDGRVVAGTWDGLDAATIVRVVDGVPGGSGIDAWKTQSADTLIAIPRATSVDFYSYLDDSVVGSVDLSAHTSDVSDVSLFDTTAVDCESSPCTMVVTSHDPSQTIEVYGQLIDGSFPD